MLWPAHSKRCLEGWFGWAVCALGEEQSRVFACCKSPLLAVQWLMTERERAADSHLYSQPWVETQKKAVKGQIQMALLYQKRGGGHCMVPQGLGQLMSTHCIPLLLPFSCVCCLTLGSLWEGATRADVRHWVLHHHHYSTGCYLEGDTNQ